MSNRRGGSGGRKPKANKNKQAKGGGNSPTSSGSQFPRDEQHNMNLPCCRLLADLTKELTAVGSQNQHIQRPDSLLGHMVRNHLLEQRNNQVIAAGSPSASSSTPTKKKKKKNAKKKKKANSNAAINPSATAAATPKEDTPKSGGGEADETDSTNVIASTVSQDSQAVSAAISTSSTKTTSTSTSVANPSSTPLTVSSTTDIVTTTPQNSSTTRVDLYLDRLLAIQQQEQGVSTVWKQPVPSLQGRDIEAFLKYLNKKHGSDSNAAGITITQQELEQACQTVVCPICRDHVNRTLLRTVEAKQPVVLPAMSFLGNNAAPTAYNHNGLAVPIHNQKPDAPPPPAPTVDFDYVAMEEGSSPMGTLLEAKADLAGIPYFHPHMATTEASNSADSSKNNSANSKKQNKKGGEESSSKGKNQMEWHFVSSSSNAVTATASTKEGSPSTPTQPAPSSFITLRDLEHVVKGVMLPLALPPDELLGTTTLSQDIVLKIQKRVTQLDDEFRKEIHNAHNEIQKYQGNFEELDIHEDANQSNMAIDYTNNYYDLDDASHHLVNDIVLAIAWDRLLWLDGGKNMSVVRPTPEWESMVAYITDQCTQTLMGMMEAVETYESKLENDIANAQGMIPQMFVHKGHRLVFRDMIRTKLRLVQTLLENVHRASEDMEEVWPETTGGRGGIKMRQSPHPHPQHQQQNFQNASGLLLYFRRKWFVEQEFYRVADAQLQRRKEEDDAAGLLAAAGYKKESSPGNNKARKETSQAEHSSGTTASGTLNGVNQKWFETLDVYGGDLLRGLLEFVKSARQGRLSEVKEEYMVRCEKLLGLLTRVGQECIRPLLEKDEQNTARYTLKDANLLTQCRHLWTQIQQQRELQQQQQLLASDGEGPSIVEQKHTVAEMTLSLLRVLRNLRKSVADSCGPKNPPLIPLHLVSWLTSPQEVLNGIDYSSVEMSKVSYNNLVCMAAAFEKEPSYCVGGSGSARLTSFFLALFYRKLSEHCSEWHAELAEQELLTTMGDSGVEGTNGVTSNASGEQNSGRQKDSAANRNGVDANATNTTTPSKKKSKKGKKKEKVAIESPAESGEPKQSSTQSSAAALNQDDRPSSAAIQEASSKSNGHQTKNAESKSESDGKEISSDSKAAEGAALSQLLDIASSKDTEESSTTLTDKKMGVKEPSGAFHTAESYLVGRLTAILNGSGPQTSSGKKSQANELVVII